MDDSLRLASLTAFYFGSGVATTTPPTTREAIRDISHRAYRDLCRTLTGIGTHPDKEHLLKVTHTSLHEFVTDLDPDPVPTLDVEAAQKNFDDRHDTWCLERMNFFDKYPHPDRKEFIFTYGQAQKWINMTLKYLAVLGHPAVLRVYHYLHIPIDTIIYEEAEDPTTGLNVPYPPDETVWSQLNRDQYQDYQRQLRDSIAGHGADSLAPLDWEAQAWINRSSGQE